MSKRLPLRVLAEPDYPKKKLPKENLKAIYEWYMAFYTRRRNKWGVKRKKPSFRKWKKGYLTNRWMRVLRYGYDREFPDHRVNYHFDKYYFDKRIYVKNKNK